MLEKTLNMYLGIIEIQSLKEGKKIWWATQYEGLLRTHSLPPWQKNIIIVPNIQVHHSQESQQAS